MTIIPFTQANGNSADFTQILSLTRIQVASNVASAVTNGVQYAGISVATIGPDMECSVQGLAAIPGSASALCVLARLDTSGNGYSFEADAGTWFLNRLDAGALTQLQTGSFTNGAHTYKIRIIGTTIQCLIDNVQVGTNQTATQHATNTKFGMLMLKNTGTLTADNYEYENLTLRQRSFMALL